MTHLQFDNYLFDDSDGTLRHADSGTSATLRPQVAKLLLCLLERSGQVVDRQTICHAVWGEGAVVDFESGLAAVVKELRQSMERTGGNPELLETVPRRGYRLCVEAVKNKSATPAHSFGTRFGWAALSGALLAAIVLGWLMLALISPGSGNPSSQSLVILPFERYGEHNTAPENAEYLIADTLLANLWQADLEGLELIGRSSVLPYAGRENVAAAVAEELSADLILEGDLIAEPNGWRVEARLLELPGGRIIWSGSHSMQDQQNPSIEQSADMLVQNLKQQWLALQQSR